MAIYTGQPLSSLGITAGGWGSGTADETSEKGFSGGSSIKFVTQGLFKGGRLDFAGPLQLTEAVPDRSECLRFTLNFSKVSAQSGSESGLPYGATTAAAAGGFDEEETTVKPKINRIRLLLQDATGAITEVNQPINVSRADASGWSKVAIPLAAIKWPVAPEQFRLKRLILATDVPDTIYIGEIRIISDATPITADAGEEQVVAARDSVVFKAAADGGASTLVYSWDFDKADGIQEEAVGPVVTHTYTKRGEYDATLTVKDYYGLKASATAIFHVSVGD